MKDLNCNNFQTEKNTGGKNQMRRNKTLKSE